MKVYEYYLKYGQNMDIKRYIIFNCKEIQDIDKAKDMTNIYYVIGAGGYHSSLTFKPWDGIDKTPSREICKSDVNEILASNFHQLTFEDDGMSDLTFYEKFDFEKDTVPSNEKEILRINRYLDIDLMAQI